MQIVIDIPEEDWEFIKESDGCRWSRAIIEGVINGKPLSAGHGRLIDADEIVFENADFDTYGDYSRAFDAIDQADTIIEADRGDESKTESKYRLQKLQLRSKK